METIGTPGLLARGARPGIVGCVMIVVGLIVGAAALADWGLREWHDWSGPAILLAIFLVSAPINRAKKSALDRRIRQVLEPWAEERGLVFQGGAGNPRTTPTLDKGGMLSAVMVGPIGGDPNGFLAHYTYTVRSGKNSYQVWMSVAVVRFEGREGLRLRLGPKQPLWGGTYGIFDDWHQFETESMEVNAAYIIETRDETDEVQLLELLDPVTLTTMLDEQAPPLIEIDNGTLLVAYAGRFGIDSGVEDLTWFNDLRAHAEAWGVRIQGI